MIILIILFVILFCFSFVLLFGAPYLPTLSKDAEKAFELAELKPGQLILELGCGDGKMLIYAAKKGVKSIGYEINPILFLIAYFRTRKYSKYASVRLANFWNVSLPKADCVYVFLLNRYMTKLDKLLNKYKYKPIKLISFAFEIPDKKSIAKANSIFLYIYR